MEWIIAGMLVVLMVASKVLGAGCKAQRFGSLFLILVKLDVLSEEMPSLSLCDSPLSEYVVVETNC